jgi:acyl-CoA synthetase (AMP-forming)/AMP-acid ligase II
MMLPTLFTGGILHVMPAFDAVELLQTATRERITHTFMVPAQNILVLDRPELHEMDRPELHEMDLGWLQAVPTAGSPLRRDTQARDHITDLHRPLRALRFFRRVCEYAETAPARGKV